MPQPAFKPVLEATFTPADSETAGITNASIYMAFHADGTLFIDDCSQDLAQPIVLSASEVSRLRYFLDGGS